MTLGADTMGSSKVQDLTTLFVESRTKIKSTEDLVAFMQEFMPDWSMAVQWSGGTKSVSVTVQPPFAYSGQPGCDTVMGSGADEKAAVADVLKVMAVPITMVQAHEHMRQAAVLAQTLRDAGRIEEAETLEQKRPRKRNGRKSKAVPVEVAAAANVNRRRGRRPRVNQH
jgi:hypothetical protein